MPPKRPLLSDEERESIDRAVLEAERRTCAEIVPVVAKASGRYDRAEDVVGLWFGIALCAGVWWFFQGVGESSGWSGVGEVRVGFWTFAALIVVGFAVGVVLASRVLWLRRLFTSSREMEEEAVSRAKKAFFDRRVHRTSAASGVLVFVSVYERCAVLIADEGVRERLSLRSLDEVRDELIAGLREDGLASGLRRGIARLGSLLETALPPAADRSSAVEIGDRVIVID